MNESPVKPIEYKILLELHKGEKSVAELTDSVATEKADKIIRELNQGNKDVRNLADILYNSRGLICLGLNELTDRGFIDEKYVILKKCHGNKPGRAGKRYWLSETGQKFYESVYGRTP